MNLSEKHIFSNIEIAGRTKHLPTPIIYQEQLLRLQSKFMIYPHSGCVFIFMVLQSSEQACFVKACSYQEVLRGSYQAEKYMILLTAFKILYWQTSKNAEPISCRS